MTTNKSVNRRLMYVSVGNICRDVGFQGASKVCLETLTELLQAYITELTRSCRKFCEHGHRTTPDLTDVKMALAEVGLSAHGLNLYSQRVKSQPVKKLNPSKVLAEHKTLKSGLPNVNQPSYIPNYMPGYPDIQAFIRTPTLREPVHQYDIVRERIATQRKATENSLVKFVANTNPADVLIFDEIDTSKFPCTNTEIERCSYLKALLYKVERGRDTTEDEQADKSDEETTESEELGMSPIKKEVVEGSDNSQTPSTDLPPVTENPYCKPAKRVRYKR